MIRFPTVMRLLQASRLSSLRAFSSSAGTVPTFSGIDEAPADPILGLNEAFKKDTASDKVNVGVGAYRTDEGLPYVLPSVKEAQKRIVEKNYNLEYAPIAGVPEFVDHAVKFAYGKDSQALRDGRIAAVQSLSGTGALRLGFEFLTKFFGKGLPIYMPNVTWGNHPSIAQDAGMEVKTYRYYDKENIAVDWEGLKADLEALPEGSVVLLQACAHNPTGVDPTHEQWDELSALMKRKNHLAFFDSAYQGFASGDADKDAYSLRKFEADGNRMMLSQSFAKNFGLYGERVGTLSVVCNDAEEQKRVLSQLKIVIRRMYSSPPLQGARIVAEVLGDEKLSKQWYQECAEMAERIKKTRSDLVEALKKAGSQKDWSHIVKQIGMFSFTGLNPQQCEKLIKDHHIYLVKSGRISIAGVTSKNVDKLAKSIHAVTSE